MDATTSQSFIFIFLASRLPVYRNKFRIGHLIITCVDQLSSAWGGDQRPLGEEVFSVGQFLLILCLARIRMGPGQYKSLWSLRTWTSTVAATPSYDELKS